MIDAVAEWAVKLAAALGVGSIVVALFNRRKTAAEVGEIEADTELKHTQAKHIRFGELESMVKMLSERMNVAERELKECKSRESRQARRMSEIETQQKAIVVLLRTNWPIDHSIPPDMMELLNKIEARHSGAARRKRKTA